jgi:uncharacterized protein (DUF1330 family)
MPAYIIAEVEITDEAEYAQYRPLAAAAVARFGGRYVVRGGEARLLEGSPAPHRVVVLEFPDAATARGWYESEDYQAALKIRQKASKGRLVLVDGVS